MDLLVLKALTTNVAVFSVVDKIVLQPLPFVNSSRLVWMIGGEKLDSTLRASIGLSGETFPVDVFQEVQRRDQAFASVSSFDPFFAKSEYTLTGTGKPQAVAGVMVAGNFFQTLGVTPELGRTFSSEEQSCTAYNGNACRLRQAFAWSVDRY